MVAAVLVFVIAAVTVGREAFRLGHQPPPTIFDVDEAVAQGIGINGLPILSIDRRLDHYYYSYVIGGPGAFMIPAANYESFAEAIVKKLILEIAANPPPPGPWGAVLARND